MQTSFIRKFNLLLLLLAFVSSFATPLAFAQIQNPIQAAKDAYNKSKQQQKQQQAAAAQPANPPPGAPPAKKTSPAASSADCCTPEAMKKIAASLGYVDIVGIKLGMTPQQAVAAIKAHNANLKIETFYARVEHPTAPGTFERIPLWISARSTSLPSSGQETISMAFTTAPSPPLLAKVARFVLFPNGQPVVKTTLVDSLDKKYGPENGVYSQTRLWIFDANAKPVTRFLTQAEKVCDPGDASDFHGGDVALDLSRVSMDESQIRAEKHAVCVPLTFVAASFRAESEAPNSPVFDMTVVLSSPALLRNSQQAMHDWLQAELDGKLKEQQDAAAKRAAPKL